MTVPATLSAALLHRSQASDPAAFPWAAEGLEEVGAGAPADAAGAWAFALSRLTAAKDARPVALVTTAEWLAERGRPFGAGMRAWGLAPERLVWVRARRSCSPESCEATVVSVH